MGYLVLFFRASKIRISAAKAMIMNIRGNSAIQRAKSWGGFAAIAIMMPVRVAVASVCQKMFLCLFKAFLPLVLL
jgi:hypothetical protein